MNLPNDDKAKQEIPDEAQGNPVYEQTRQDMPLWCCGRNCGRNTRFVVLGLALVGIACSIWACISVKYFSFVALRNDTFYDPEKAQPPPFEYATEANVGLFKYEILDVFVYPWPPERERALFDEMLLGELRRMQEDADAGNSTDAPVDDTGASLGDNATETGAPTFSATESPTAAPTLRPECNGVVVPGPGSVACGVSLSPTTQPSSAPTPINPNDIVEETVDIGVVKRYPDGIGMFDSTFTNAQRGAIMGPVFAFLGTVFGLIELCCCTYKCSWLPTALFLYLAFMFQLFTMFLFLSEDWCKYEQDCALGNAGFGSVIAVICYMFAQSLVCCSPRPPPIFNLCPKKSPPKKKKKKRKDGEDDDEEAEGLKRGYDDPDYEGRQDSFRDEPGSAGYVDPYDNETEDDYDYGGDSYMDPSTKSGYPEASKAESDPYYDDAAYDDGTYNDQSYAEDDGGSSYYTEDDDGADYDSNYDDSQYSNSRS